MLINYYIQIQMYEIINITKNKLVKGKQLMTLLDERRVKNKMPKSIRTVPLSSFLTPQKHQQEIKHVSSLAISIRGQIIFICILTESS